MAPTPWRPPLGGSVYPYAGERHDPGAPVSPGRDRSRLTPRFAPSAGHGTAGAADESTRKLFLNCLALLSGAAGLIHFAAVPSHIDESALHGAFFVGTGLAQLAGAALLVHSFRKWVLVATAVGNALILAIWLMSRTAGVPVEPHAWTPEPVGIADSVASLLELGLVAGSSLLMSPLGGASVARPPLRRPKLLLGSVASVVVALTGLALIPAARGEGHSHVPEIEASSEHEGAVRSDARSLAPAAPTTNDRTAAAVETSPTPVYQPLTPAEIQNQARVAAVVPQPAPVIEPPASVVEPPPVASQPEPPPAHTHEGDAQHEH